MKINDMKNKWWTMLLLPFSMAFTSAASANSYICPLPSCDRVTAEFRGAEEGNPYPRGHWGMDFAVPVGTPVFAAKDGVVERVGRLQLAGIYVLVKHDERYETLYIHLDEVLVEVGGEVEEGQEIAKSGNTGLTTGPHLHFEVREDGKAINPRPLLSL